MTIEEKIRKILEDYKDAPTIALGSHKIVYPIDVATQAILELLMPSKVRLIETVKLKIRNLPIAGDFDATRVMYLNDKAIEGVADALLELINGREA